MSPETSSPPSSKAAVTLAALSAALAIPNEWQRSRALRALARLLPPDARLQALESALSMTDSSSRGQTLAELARLLSGEKQDQALQAALAAARDIADPAGRARVLNAAAPLLPVAAGLEAGRQALSALQAVDDLSLRAFELGLAPDELLPQAVAVAREIPAGWARAEALGALANRLPAAQRGPLLEEARSVAEGISDPGARAVGLAGLAGSFAGEAQERLAAEALEAARASSESSATVFTLAALETSLSPGLWAEARDLARSIPDLPQQVEALLALVPAATEAERKALLREILDRLPQLGDWPRSAALLRLAGFLPAGLREEALAAARSLSDPWAQARALAGLARRFPPEIRPELFTEALSAALAAPQGWPRARALIDLAVRME